MNLTYQPLRELLCSEGTELSRQSLTSFLAWPVALSLAIVLFVFLWAISETRPTLSDPVPFIFNSCQFIFANERFMKRVSKRLETVNLAKFNLFNKSVFLIAGPKNVPIVLSRSNKIGLEASWIDTVFPMLYNMPSSDIARFASDKSGADRVPASGSEHLLSQHRLWFGFHNVHNEYLSKSQHFRPLVRFYYDRLLSTLGVTFPAGEWLDVSLSEFVRGQIATCSIEMLFGPRLFEVTPNLLDAFWDFDRHILKLISLPKWLARDALRAQAKYTRMVRAYLEDAFSTGHNDSISLEDEEPGNGAHLAPRMIVQWIRDSGLQDESAVGALSVLMFALISNTIPITQWMILEVVRDPFLLSAVRAEVATTCTIDPATGVSKLSTDKVVSLPLLQSIFTETLRLRMNFNIFRDVQQDITLDGCKIFKGEMLQIPMPPAHCDEAVWGTAEHPAQVFWAERHIRYEKATRNDASRGKKEPSSAKPLHGRIFAPLGRPSSYFPFGGGHHICPGRHLAKAEILTTVALLVNEFDIELVEWTKMDGSTSDRMARSDPRYSGAGAMPPDRDLKMRWRRRGKRSVDQRYGPVPLSLGLTIRLKDYTERSRT